jgi:hypothetical protein
MTWIGIVGAAGCQNAYSRYLRCLLRTRGERQNCWAASNYFDEIAPSHCRPRDKRQDIVPAETSVLEGGFGSLADIVPGAGHVCFTPESGHVRCNWQCPLWAKSGHVQCTHVCLLRATRGNRVDYDRSGNNAAARGKITRTSTSIEPPCCSTMMSRD